MSILSRTLLLLTATGALCFADIDYLFVNPNFPNASSDGSAHFGSVSQYGIKSAEISDVGTAWTLTIQTNYLDPNIGGTVGAIPAYCDNGAAPPCTPGSNEFFLADFLIQQGNKFYGVVLSDHSPYAGGYSDGYLAGNLYGLTGPGTSCAPGLLDAAHNGFCDATVFGKGPVILAKGGSQINTGATAETAVANAGCNSLTGKTSLGVACPEFAITDKFTASATFLDPSQAFTIWASSADCNNEFINATTPEPSFAWLVPPILLVGGYVRRRLRTRVS